MLFYLPTCDGLFLAYDMTVGPGTKFPAVHSNFSSRADSEEVMEGILENAFPREHSLANAAKHVSGPEPYPQ